MSSINYDLIIVVGQNSSLVPVLKEAYTLKINPHKIILDRTICILGFSLKRYKRLFNSRLSIFSMGNWGNIVNAHFDFPFLSSSLNLSVSDEEFINFLHKPQSYIEPEIQEGINWFNLLVVMYTENPSILAKFDNLPYVKKVCFVPFKTDLESGFYIDPEYYYGYELKNAVQAVATGAFFDVWDILLYSEKKPLDNIQRLVVNENEIINTRVFNYETSKYVTSDKKIRYFNWWPLKEGEADDVWLTRFIKKYVSSYKTFNFFSVHGDDNFVRNCKADNKIFFSIEEHFIRPSFRKYMDYCLGSVDFASGFAYFDTYNYLHFPYWLMSTFEPKIDLKYIENRIKEINLARNTRKFDCVILNRHDTWNTRTPIYSELKNILDIKCAGNWNNNTDELKKLYNDDKRKYVHEFMFNICPENVNNFGYVTEKIFDAFIAGSIPIYYGSDNNPEEGIINKNAVLFWEMDKDNEELKKEIIRLKTDEQYYNKFMSQEKLFTKNTVEYVYSTLEKLAKALKEMK